jgi:hypothetical protein
MADDLSPSYKLGYHYGKREHGASVGKDVAQMAAWVRCTYGVDRAEFDKGFDAGWEAGLKESPSVQ